MEYASNGNLFAYTRKHSKLTDAETKRIFLQVCEAISYMHKKGILHRDLKPENVLLDDAKNVKLCDFGWSAQRSKTRMTFCGTYEYMAPEIFAHKKYDEKIDVWSLGVLLYELLHGHSPFRGDSAIHIYKNILKNDVKFKVDVDSSAKDLILKILRVKPDERINMTEIISHNYFATKGKRKHSKSPDISRLKEQFKKPLQQSKGDIKVVLKSSVKKTETISQQIIGRKKKMSEIRAPTLTEFKDTQQEMQLTSRVRKPSVASVTDIGKTAKRNISKNSGQKIIIDFFSKMNQPGPHNSINSRPELKPRMKNLSLSISKNMTPNTKPSIQTPITPFNKFSTGMENPNSFKLTPSHNRRYYEILDQATKNHLATKESNVIKKLSIKSTKHIKNILSLAPTSPIGDKSASIQSLRHFIDTHKKNDSLKANLSSSFKQRYFEKLKLVPSPTNKENVNYLALKNTNLEVENPYYGPF